MCVVSASHCLTKAECEQKAVKPHCFKVIREMSVHQNQTLM